MSDYSHIVIPGGDAELGIFRLIDSGFHEQLKHFSGDIIAYSAGALLLMKRFLYIAFILLGVGLLSSCEKNGGSRLSFEGTWDVVKTEMETVQGDRTPCWNEYDKFLFSDSAQTGSTGADIPYCSRWDTFSGRILPWISGKTGAYSRESPARTPLWT